MQHGFLAANEVRVRTESMRERRHAILPETFLNYKKKKKILNKKMIFCPGNYSNKWITNHIKINGIIKIKQ